MYEYYNYSSNSITPHQSFTVKSKVDINDAYIIIQQPNKQCKTTQTVRSIWISPLCPRMPTSLVAQGAIIAWTDEGLTVPTASTTHVFVFTAGVSTFIIVPQPTQFI